MRPRYSFIHAALLALAGLVAAGPGSARAADVIKFVSFVSGAIGYVRPEEVDASVKVIRVDGLAPGDPGYKLKL